MSKQQDMDIALRRCRLKDQETKAELELCRRRGKATPQYLTMVKDARKLWAEYHKIAKRPESNPLSIKHGAKFQREKIIGDLMGRNGPDTHHGIDGDKDRRVK